MPAKNSYLLMFLLIFIISLSLSCSVERKIAKEYIADDSTRSVLVIPPDYIFKNSLKEWEIDSADELDDWSLDSLLFEKSLFLKYIDDSIFLDYYMSNYLSEMEALGFRVYGQDSLISFLSGKSNAFIVNIAQIELEEFVMPIKEEEQFDGYLYYIMIDLNAVNLNSDRKSTRLNEEEDKALFFASHYLTDELEGYFKNFFLTGEVQFSYEIDTLLVDEIYRLGALAGYLYAGYTFDYLMNRYLDQRMDTDGLKRSDIYYHYERQRRFLGVAKEEDRFIPMD